MKIELKAPGDRDFRTVTVRKGQTIESVYKSLEEKLPYAVLAAKKDNKVVPLTAKINAHCRIELLDGTTVIGNQTYQHGLTMMYLYSIEKVIGRVRVEIQNSLNKGIYTEIFTKEPVTAAQIDEIEKAMKQLAEDDVPFETAYLNRRETEEFLKDADLQEKLRLVESMPKRNRFKEYKLNDFGNFFYDIMPPSTGYIKVFSLRKYKKGVLLRFPYMEDPGRLPKYVDRKYMYDAFEQAKEWQEILGIHYAIDLNDKNRDGEMARIMLLSEALHQKRIVEIVKNIITQKKRIVLVAGPSSSGKTTFAKQLCIHLNVNGKKPLYLGTDDYFLNRVDTPLDENGEPNFEDLDALDIELFENNMNALLEGKEVDLPRYDFISGRKVYGERITTITQDSPIVIEGIHALNGALTSHIADKWKYKIYISPLTQLNIDAHTRIPTTDMRMLRRIVRDYKYRGHSAKETIREWPKVRAGEEKNIFPFGAEADDFFNSILIYEMGVLRKYAQPLLEQITPEDREYCDAKRLLRLLDFFDTIEDDEMIVNTSILREFIGGSVFVE
ncbi:MAG: nucleoside kinase [Anaerovoracaceae bacterium]|jgi:uridine kinase